MSSTSSMEQKQIIDEANYMLETEDIDETMHNDYLEADELSQEKEEVQELEVETRPDFQLPVKSSMSVVSFFY